jgi:AraC family transcriptional regulator of adaptative response/methylated-DNA-[protein]-cysteine methyltransferase
MTTSPSTDHAEARAAIAARDARFDGRFVYGVTSTGIYCRPSCPSRRPRPDRVVLFDSPGEAERAGFRPCRRCAPRERRAPHDARLDHARAYLDAHADEAVTVAQLSRHVGLTRSHLQRAFAAAFGVTPRAYLAARRSERFRAALREGDDVTTSIYAAGYGSPSRVYEHASARLGMSPATYRRGGEGTRIRFTTAPSEAGVVLLAATDRGVCAARLGDDDAALERALRSEFPRAALERDDRALKAWVAELTRRIAGRPPRREVPLDVAATAFQWQVWQSLKRIPRGETRSYGDVARTLGRPGAARAVAAACAANPVAVIVPCHRVVGASGAPGGYRWGPERKARLLERETAGGKKAPDRGPGPRPV